MTWQTLIDTRKEFDAGLLGYDGPCDPTEVGDGLILRETRSDDFVEVHLATAYRDVSIYGWPAIREVAKSLVDVALQEPGGNSLTKARDELAALKAANDRLLSQLRRAGRILDELGAGHFLGGGE